MNYYNNKFRDHLDMVECYCWLVAFLVGAGCCWALVEVVKKLLGMIP